MRWVFADAWRNRAEAITAVPWLDLDRLPGAKPLKISRSRRLWYLEVGGCAVVAKIYRPADAWERMKWLLLGSPGWREYRTAVFAETRALDVIRPVAFARGTCGIHLFISEALKEAAPLSARWLDAERNRPRRRLLIASAARLVHDLHASDLRPFDLHPENVLIQELNGTVRAVLVDLHRAKCGHRASARHRAGNLAELGQWFRHQASRTDLLRFWHAYAGRTGRGPRARRRAEVERIRRAILRRAVILARKRDRRIYGDNSYVGCVRLPGGWRGYVLLRGPRAGNGSPLDRQVFSKSLWLAALPELLSAAVQKQPAATGDPGVMLGSRWVAVNCQRSLGGSAQPRTLWEQAHHRLNRLERTPLPLALLERPSPAGTESVLILERVEG